MSTIFKVTNNTGQKLEEHKAQAIAQLNEFFDVTWTPESVAVLIADSRDSFDKLSGFKTLEWMVGFALSTNCVVLLAPGCIQQENAHEYSEEFYNQILTHEICHLYFEVIFGKCNFRWIVEGIATYTTSQITLVNELKGFLDNQNVYAEASLATKILIEKLGKDKYMEFLKAQSNCNSREGLDIVFKQIYGGELDYAFFNNFLDQTATLK